MSFRSPDLGIFAVGFALFVAVSCAGTHPDVDATPTARMKVDAHIGKNLTDDGKKIDQKADDFGPTETVYAVVDVPGSMDGTLQVRWFRGDTQLNEQSTMLQADTHAYSFQMPPAEGGNPVGDYRLDVYVNSDRKESETFHVK